MGPPILSLADALLELDAGQPSDEVLHLLQDLLVCVVKSGQPIQPCVPLHAQRDSHCAPNSGKPAPSPHQSGAPLKAPTSKTGKS